MLLTLIAGLVGLASAQNSKSFNGALGLFTAPTCGGVPQVVVKAHPGECVRYPGSTSYFQLLCGLGAGKDTSGSYNSGDMHFNSSDYSNDGAGAWGDASYSSNGWEEVAAPGRRASATDASSSSSSSGHANATAPPAPSHAPVPAPAHPYSSHVAIRLCKDAGCNSCRKIVVTKTNQCTALPKGHWARDSRGWAVPSFSSWSDWNHNWTQSFDWFPSWNSAWNKQSQWAWTPCWTSPNVDRRLNNNGNGNHGWWNGTNWLNNDNSNNNNNNNWQHDWQNGDGQQWHSAWQSQQNCDVDSWNYHQWFSTWSQGNSWCTSSQWFGKGFEGWKVPSPFRSFIAKCPVPK